MRNLETFDRAWSLVDQRYWDPDFGGVDWPAIKDELRPLARAAESDAALRRVMQSMIERLGQSHFAIIPASADDGATPLPESCDQNAWDELLAGVSSGHATPGFEALNVEGEVLVSHLDPGGGAEEAGLTVGDRLVGLSGFDPLLAWQCTDDHLGGRSIDVFARQVLTALMAGEEGSTLDLVIERAGEDGETQSLSIARSLPADLEVVRFGNLPPQPVRRRFEVVDGPVGDDGQPTKVALVRFNTWMMPVSTLLDENAPRLAEASAVVIDLRGNPGGVAGLVMGVAGYFIDEKISMGSMLARTNTLEYNVNPRLVTTSGERIEVFDGPVAVLVDAASASTSEIFAAGMQDLGRARIIGTRTAGAALPATMERLPNGDVLVHAMADFERPSGQRVEGLGVEPDDVVPVTRRGLEGGRDEVLDAAFAWLESALNRPDSSP